MSQNRRCFLGSLPLALGGTLLRAQQGVHAPGVVTEPVQDTAIPRGRKRDLLQKQCPPEALRSSLLAPENFRPFPVLGDSQWNALLPQTRERLVQAGEKALARPYQAMPATLFLEYARMGNRSRYEAVRYANLAVLHDSVFAECVENKGRFLDHIADGIWSICEQSFWGVPAHLYIQRVGLGLPDPNDPIVDLFAGDTAALLATSVYLLGDRLDTVSPQVRRRVLAECERRVFNPLLTQNLMWMGLPGGKQRDDLPWDSTAPGMVQPVNNWDAWISWNWITTSLLLDPDAERRARSVQKAVVCMDNFINTYPDDGGCEEGPSYYNRAAVCMFMGLEMLGLATNGRMNIWADPLLRRMGEYLIEARIAGDQYLNTGDAHTSSGHERGASSFDRHTVYRFGKCVNSPGMVALARAELTDVYLPSTLPDVFCDAALRAEPERVAPLLLDVWLPDTGLFAARMKADSPSGFYVACIAADNGKSHSHNDTGSIWLYLDGEPVLIDLGRETYRKQSFDDTRYQMFSTQSAYHNLPGIGQGSNAVQQGIGSAFRATDLHHTANGSTSSLSCQLAKAYPDSARLRSLQRTVQLDRPKKRVSVVDSYRLRAANTVTWSFMTCRTAQTGEGRLVLAPRAEDTSGPVTMGFDANLLQVQVEAIPLTDEALVEAWGKQVNRVLVFSRRAVDAGESTFVFTS